MRMFSSNPQHVIRRASSAGEHASRRLLWVPLVVGGLLTAVLASRRSPMRMWLDRWRGSSSGKRRTTSEAFSLLRNAILGNNKSAIASVFGAPPATAGGFLTGHYHQADTWYYPLDAVEKSAMVIQFENGIAREAMRIVTPGAC